MKNYIFNHTEQNPLIVEDYPYGFNLRTTIKYWIETQPKKGDRFCSQTLNPKNGRWNAAKKSTYNCVGVMFLDEKGHTHWTGISQYTDRSKCEAFINEIGGVEKLNPEQLKQYNSLMGINEVKRDEFTDKIVKDYSVKWERETIGAGWKDGKYNNGEKGKYVELKITFDRPDGVSLNEVFKAMKSVNQDKLKEVFEIRKGSVFGAHPGTVRLCTRGGSQLATIGEDEYNDYLASDRNTLEEEKEVQNEY